MGGPVALSWQPPLFPSPAGPLERLTLEPGCWVDHAVAWLPGPDDVFGELVATLPWAERDRMMYGRRVAEPRLTARWPSEGMAMPRVLDEARAALSERYEVDLDSVGFNLYRDGGDSVAWHRDRIPVSIERPVVALVSLGAPRPFRLRPRGGGTSIAFNLGSGDLLVTGGQTQRQWEHAVPKQRSAGPRVSIAFRHSSGNGPE